MALGIIQNGRFLELLGKQEVLHPFRNLEAFKGELRFIWAYHGRQDSAVPSEGTEKLGESLKKVGKDGKWKVTVVEVDHHFDATATLDDGWLEEGLREVGRYWS